MSDFLETACDLLGVIYTSRSDVDILAAKCTREILRLQGKLPVPSELLRARQIDIDLDAEEDEDEDSSWYDDDD